MKVFELTQYGLRSGLFATYGEADKYPGTDARPRYQIREVDLPVVFLLDRRDRDYDDPGRPYRAFATYEAAAQARQPDDDIVVWELETKKDVETPETPEFDSLVAALIDDIVADQMNDRPLDHNDIRERLVRIWNARGAADRQAARGQLDVDRAIKALDRKES